MFVVALLTMALIIVLALALMAVVAVSSGRLTLNRSKWVSLVDKTNEHLNAQGDTPQFLERLDTIGAGRR